MKLHSVLVMPNYKKQGTADVVRRVLTWADAHDICVLVLQEHARRIPAAFHENVTSLTSRNEKKLLADCSLVLTIGGDGTLIRGAAYAAKYQIPITGVNTGTLGFLADIYPRETEDKLERLLQGDCAREVRSGISASWEGGNVGMALNDIVLIKTSKGGLCGVMVYFGDELVGRYRADGLIVTTPTGSTGYSYTAGGPIIHAGADVIGITPLCPQYRMNIPLVCAADRPIRIIPTQGSIHVAADGKAIATLKEGCEMRITKAREQIELIRFADAWGVIDWMERVGRLG